MLALCFMQEGSCCVICVEEVEVGMVWIGVDLG
jgi:hypothetical protein